VSTSRSVRSSAIRRPWKFAMVSASACSVDQRTAPKGREGLRGPSPTSQNPPSSAGPNTASARPSARNAARTSAARMPGMSLPTTTTRRCGRVARSSRAPRSPLPCQRTGQRRGQRARAKSGVAAMTVRQRREGASRASTAASVAR
jgi:hypothetical protein